MRRIYILLFSIIFILMTTHLSSPMEEVNEALKYTIKFATIAPEGSTWVKVLKKAEDAIEEKSNGQIKVIFYGSGVMGSEDEVVEKMRSGEIQMGAFTVLGIDYILPEMIVITLPFLINSFDEVDFLRGTLFQIFDDFCEERGFILVSWFDAGGFAQFFSKNPIYTVEDLKKQKVWSWTGHGMDEAIFNALGVNTIKCKLKDVYSMLYKGNINMVWNTPLGALATQWYKQINYMTKLDIGYGPGVIVSTKKFWEKIPMDFRDLIMEEFQKWIPELIYASKRDDNIAVLGMYKRGIKIIKVAPKEKERFKEKIRVVWDKFADDLYPRWLLDHVILTLDEYRNSDL